LHLLWPVRVFDRLGVSEAVLKQSIIPNSLLMLDSVDGGIIARIPTRASFVERFKHPYIVIHRVDLHHILLDACKANSDIEFMPMTSCIGYEDLGDIVRLRIQGDECIEGVAIVGADGLRSTIRQQMVREGEPRTIGFVAHRTIVPMSEVSADVRRNDVVLWSGMVRAGLSYRALSVARWRTFQHRRGIQDGLLSRTRRHQKLSC
jgi:3-hydroxybenzoate 6-monooxygenase